MPPTNPEFTRADAAKAVGCKENDVLSFSVKPDGEVVVVTIFGRKLSSKNKKEG